MSADPRFALHEPVTVVLRGLVDAEYDHLLGRPSRVVHAIQIDCDGQMFVIPYQEPGVDVIRDHDVIREHIEVASLADKDTIVQALADAVAYRECGVALVGCRACEANANRCAEHGPDAPQVAAYRVLLGRLSTGAAV